MKLIKDKDCSRLTDFSLKGQGVLPTTNFQP